MVVLARSHGSKAYELRQCLAARHLDLKSQFMNQLFVVHRTEYEQLETMFNVEILKVYSAF